MGFYRFARAAWVVLAFAACDAETGSGGAEADGPLASVASPAVEWTFDACQVDSAWTYPPANDASAGEWVTMTPRQEATGGCSARLDFTEDGASIAFDPQGVAGKGYGYSLRVLFPTCPDGQTCVGSFVFASKKETGDYDSETIWRYEIRAVLKGGKVTVQALGYRESPYGGEDLEKVEVACAEGLVTSDVWTDLALAVDRAAGVLSLWVDGELQGKKAFSLKTFEVIDRFAVRGEAWVPTADQGPGSVSAPLFSPYTLYVDDVRLYAFTAAQLAELASAP